jgi:hypothetical protein
VFETGQVWKGVWIWLVFAICLEVVSLGKAFGTGQFTKGVLGTVSLGKVFETGQFAKRI